MEPAYLLFLKYSAHMINIQAVLNLCESVYTHMFWVYQIFPNLEVEWRQKGFL